ncbi:MAG TPA: hypothetical protein VMY37_31770 [Thermoguttaceae bacterium]|nr:hypothetical protein [Thermoguttaceae bacterium]HUU90217.1 hypothetical protein [Phycisphaerae bacterium]
MATQNREEVLRCSTGALMMIYYVVVGLAITEALQNTFLNDGSFMAARAFSTENLPKTLLFLALLPTICRFVHGASMHLGVLGEKRYKPLVDFLWFCLQASIFYLMAFSLDTLVLFSVFFGILLLFDAAWLVLLRLLRYVEFGPTEKQWLVSDTVISSALALYVICRVDECITDASAASLILLVAVAATVWDYVANRDFYFPKQNPAGP